MSADQFGTFEQVDAVHSGVLIETVDGGRHGMRSPRSYRLAPREHALRARANGAFHASTPQTAYFDVLPDGQYRVQSMAAPDAGEWGVSIVDARSGERVDRLWSQAPRVPRGEGGW